MPSLALSKRGLGLLLVRDVPQDDLDRRAPAEGDHGPAPLHRDGPPVGADEVHGGARALVAAQVGLDVPFDVPSCGGMDDLEDGPADELLRSADTDQGDCRRVREDDRAVLVDQDGVRRQLDQVPIRRLPLGELLPKRRLPGRVVPDGERTDDRRPVPERGGRGEDLQAPAVRGCDREREVGNLLAPKRPACRQIGRRRRGSVGPSKPEDAGDLCGGAAREGSPGDRLGPAVRHRDPAVGTVEHSRLTKCGEERGDRYVTVHDEISRRYTLFFRDKIMGFSYCPILVRAAVALSRL